MRGITCQRWDILCWQAKRQNITLAYRDFELYDGKQTDCFCHATKWPPEPRRSLFSNSSAVHLKIFPSEAGADGTYKTPVSPQRNIATNIQHIFLSLSCAGSYHLAGTGGSKVRQEYLSAPNERQYKRCLSRLFEISLFCFLAALHVLPLIIQAR